MRHSRNRVLLACCAAVIVLAVPPYLRAQSDSPDLEQRIKLLEEKLSSIETPADAIPIPEPNPKITSGWDNGFILRSPDEQFQLRITGQVQTDFRGYLAEGDKTDIDSFVVRRARLGIEANVLKYYEFRFLPDFGVGQARIADAFFNMHYWDEFQVEIGKFKQPFSYEQLIQDRFVPLMERSLIDQLVPARDVGIMLHGQKLLDDRFDWGTSISNGEQNGDQDLNNAKDIAARVAIRPFRGQSPLLENLQLGMAVTFGNQNEPTTGFLLRTPAGIPFFRFLDGVRADGLRTRLSPEIVYFLGGFGIAAQYFRMDQEFRPPGNLRTIDVPFDGFYAMATYLLTGETRTTYSVGIDPLQPFDPRPGQFGMGAWELVGRVSRLRLGDDVFLRAPNRLADPTRFSNTATELTLGFNWYLNRWVRMQFNWEHAWFGRPVQLGPGPSGFIKQEDTLQTRLQIVF